MKKGIINVVFYISVILLIVNVALLALNVAGVAYPVMGVSMQPKLYTGYIAFIQPVNISQLQVNKSIVVYYNPFYRELVIHHVVGRVNNGVIVQGFNKLTNPTPDMNFTSMEPLVVTQSMIRGVVVFYAPLFGFFILRPYSYIVLVFFLVMLVLKMIVDRKPAQKLKSTDNLTPP
ncbi:MAG: hypothetical protein JRN26_07730 [Nitrososphaerota archaeon]|jgi:hypothetical protein|nr:hypothetical protein [Nitrososphaerota archaeon]MDG6927294.1 hypothetical protein [Nitrososphaerota archaeon]MDG6930348.1 hypothetical protein [Nitrososphaerota archaeon]MDG6931704.1 hypothetical protein [Nitrososphaerota archaeon]MDG6936752.1 hypothetical protein [Nitrososphaerota archaeon]